MRKYVCTVATIAAMVGCGGAAASGVSNASGLAFADQTQPSNSNLAAATDTPTFAAIDQSALPSAPWAQPALASQEAPAPLLLAWSRADNRDWCAPIVPRSFGQGAHARATEAEGGWAVEFDQAGHRGLGRDGTGCASCGRGVFGIVGSSMTPEEIVTPESEQTVPAPTFSDGSHSEIENSDGVAAATITVAGQGCVYQVWSFLGQTHVEELVRELRLVEVPRRGTNSAVARAQR